MNIRTTHTAVRQKGKMRPALAYHKFIWRIRERLELMTPGMVVSIIFGIIFSVAFTSLCVVVCPHEELTVAEAIEQRERAMRPTFKSEALAEKKHTLDSKKEILSYYKDLAAENSDFVGWITIDDTAVDYPVMHTPQDPERYLKTSFGHEYDPNGVPFVDARCSVESEEDKDSDNLIIYGHNMKSGRMFASIMKYQKQSFYEEHPLIEFDSLYETRNYQVIAAFYDRVYYSDEDCFKFYNFIDAADKAEFDDAVEQFKHKSLYDTGVSASYGDSLITLVTCAYQTENGRFVVVAKQV